MTDQAGERPPALAFVDALKGRTVIDATCDAEGNDDVRLRLDNGIIIHLDA